MKKTRNVLVGILLLMTLIFLLRPVRDALRGYFEVTYYPMGQMDDGNFTVPLNRTIYRVYPKEFRAIYWMPGIDGTPSTLVDCAVRDRCNWQCSYPDHSGVVKWSGCREPAYEVGKSWESRSASWFTWWRYRFL